MVEGVTNRVVILGGGTGGTIAANRLRHRFDERELTITLVDRNDWHVYQPGEVDAVDLATDTVRLEDGSLLPYDVLVVASGATLLPEETEGLTGPGWREKACTFYDVEGASALEVALARFDGGRILVNIVDLPIKCPVAPLEFAFLADWYFHDRGIRDKVELAYVTPLDGAFTKPVASKQLGGILEEKGIELITEFNRRTGLVG